MSDTPKIYAAISAVMAKINAISKGRRNQQQGFVYRGVDDVMNELHPVLAECNVFIVPEVLEETQTERPTKSGGLLFCVRQKIKFTFYTDDGSSLSAVVVGEGMDSADKASNKALSIGFKYACLQVFCIPTEDEKDPDAQSPEPVKQPPKPSAPPKKEVNPADVEKIKTLLDAKHPNGMHVFSENEKNRSRAEFANGRALSEIISELQKTLDARLAIPSVTPRDNAGADAAFDKSQEEMIF